MKTLTTLLLALLLLVGCSQPTSTTEAMTEANAEVEVTTESVTTEATDAAKTEVESEENNTAYTGDFIINAEELKAKMNDENVIIIDARGEDGAKDGRVKGAHAIAWGQLANVSEKKPGEEGWGHVLSAEQLQTILGDLGIDKNKEIILYSVGKAGWGEDGRILWELDAAGYENLKMVDGGWPAIEKAGIEMTKDVPEVKPVSVEISEIKYDNIIDTKSLTEEYENYKVIDTREKIEYDGATLYGEAKGGHLPGAINIPYSSLYREDGMLKSNKEIQEIFADAGLEKTDAIVTYCTGGIRSAFMQKILQMEGYNNVKNYEGSYYNWAAVNEVE